MKSKRKRRTDLLEPFVAITLDVRHTGPLRTRKLCGARLPASPKPRDNIIILTMNTNCNFQAIREGCQIRTSCYRLQPLYIPPTLHPPYSACEALQPKAKQQQTQSSPIRVYISTAPPKPSLIPKNTHQKIHNTSTTNKRKRAHSPPYRTGNAGTQKPAPSLQLFPPASLFKTRANPQGTMQKSHQLGKKKKPALRLQQQGFLTFYKIQEKTTQAQEEE